MRALATSASSDPREALLAVYAVNDSMNQLILEHLDRRAWRTSLPGRAGRARTIASIFAHLHNCRLRWLKKSAPHLKRPRPLDPHRCTLEQAAAGLEKSAVQSLKMLAEALSSHSGRRVTLFRRDDWMPVWPANPTMFAYMFAHEAHHRGQILMLAHQLGYPLAKGYRIWHWDKFWKQAGIPRPK
ncbi:MAG TPA: DinB family protein [Candidatus Cybelea sp.]|nr:DinB family protein [Candidatus Cybelea sp.]